MTLVRLSLARHKVDDQPPSCASSGRYIHARRETRVIEFPGTGRRLQIYITPLSAFDSQLPDLHHLYHVLHRKYCRV